MKVLSVAGFHHTGKTTTTVELIKELKKRGHKVVSIKDIHRENFTMEKTGSNSWKHLDASGNVVFARGLKETYQIWQRRLTLNEMLEHLSADYVIVEGIKSAALPRILCAKDTSQLDELIDGTVFAISGIFADENKEYKEIPVFSSRNEIERLTDLIEKTVFPVLPQSNPDCCTACGTDCYGMVKNILSGKKKRSDCKTDRGLNIHIKFNNKEIKIVPFVQETIKDVIVAMTQKLKGYKKGKIEITINEK